MRKEERKPPLNQVKLQVSINYGKVFDYQENFTLYTPCIP